MIATGNQFRAAKVQTGAPFNDHRISKSLNTAYVAHRIGM